MTEPGPVPDLEEFLRTCREEFHFLEEGFGFREVAPESAGHFRIRFEKDDRFIELRGEGYGTTAACHIGQRSAGPLSLIYLVPQASRPKRSRKRDRMGQLDHIREWAQFAHEHAVDFLGGDSTRFDLAWTEYQRITRPGGPK